MRRRLLIHANFLQAPPIAVFSFFKSLVIARGGIRPNADYNRHIKLAMLPISGISRPSSARQRSVFVPYLSLMCKQALEKFRRLAVPYPRKRANGWDGAAADASGRNCVILRRSSAHFGKSKQGGGDFGTGKHLGRTGSLFDGTGTSTEATGSSAYKTDLRPNSRLNRRGRPERLEARSGIQEFGAGRQRRRWRRAR
jgi:hypothetical protein